MTSKLDIFWRMEGLCLECNKVHKKESAVLRCKENFERKGNVWAERWLSCGGGGGGVE